MAPTKPLRPCAAPGCPRLTDSGRCPQHQRQARTQYNETVRDKAAQRFYNSPAWKALRASKLRKDPFCEVCLREGRTVAAVIVHHNDGCYTNNNESNLVSICFMHHEQTKR